MLPLILVAAAATLCFCLVFLALSGPAGGRAQGRRLQAVRARHATSADAQQLRRAVAARSDTALDSWVARLLPRPDALRQRLGRTGRSWTLGQYGIASGVLAVAAMLLLRLEGVPMLIALLLGLAIGLGVPHQLVSFLIARRVTRFTAKFPDAIELLVRGLRSGLPISETLGVVGTEVPDPVGEEFRAVADRIKIGRTMDAALQETAERLGTPEFQFFCITLAIQRETGGNMAETLSNLADVLRKRAQMKLKIRALSSESKASAYIVGALPFIVFALIWMVSSDYLAGFFKETRLMIAGSVGIIWMSIGGFIMARMVRFEI
ncbi:type II secretion system F family protein [Sphingomonas sp. XMGL2]|uniref:Type II secretion system F family protein n=1 Tax=Sphingomonas quercus TaxID=2842451 RepID=A0ABS6BNQ9_9SPHN|nr:type II secretion system F family protein [Sphingomonas quercus]MBU3079026.1 type II secretion system F family protein [Sphingomonas quercus]